MRFNSLWLDGIGDLDDLQLRAFAELPRKHERVVVLIEDVEVCSAVVRPAVCMNRRQIDGLIVQQHREGKVNAAVSLERAFLFAGLGERAVADAFRIDACNSAERVDQRGYGPLQSVGAEAELRCAFLLELGQDIARSADSGGAGKAGWIVAGKDFGIVMCRVEVLRQDGACRSRIHGRRRGRGRPRAFWMLRLIRQRDPYPVDAGDFFEGLVVADCIGNSSNHKHPLAKWRGVVAFLRSGLPWWKRRRRISGCMGYHVGRRISGVKWSRCRAC